MNPVEADANGRFPQVFAAEGAVFDILEKDADGNTLATYVDVSCVGDDSGTFTREMPDGTRLKFTGSGGRVLMQVGDPDPDATGGTLTIEGWAGTQGDELLLDFALLNTTGRIKENSKKLESVVYTGLTTLGAAASQIIALPEDPADVRMYEIDIFDLSAAGVTALTLQASVDNSLTYKSGAADYLYAKTIFDNTAGGVAFSDSAGDTKIDIVYALRTAANRLARVKLLIVTPDSGQDRTTFFSTYECCDRTTANRLAFGNTSGELVGGASYGRVTHVKIAQVGGGNISFKYRLVIHRGTGDA